MRRRSFTITLAAVLLAVSGAAGQEQDRRPGIAVFPFANGGSFGPDAQNLTDLGVGMQSMMITELAENPALRVVERATLQPILQEHELGVSGRIDPQTAARMGRLVGARYAVTGGFTDNFGTMRLDARIIDVETGAVIKAQQVTRERTELFAMVLDVSLRLTADVNLPPLPAEIREQREQQEIPAEAIEMLSKALVYQDAGRKEQAIELYKQINNRFPDVTEAKKQLTQLGGA